MTAEREATAEVNVTIRDVPTEEYLGRRFTSAVGEVGRDVQDGFARLYTRIREAKSQPSGPPFLIASQPHGGEMEIEVGAPCVPVPEPCEGLDAGRLPGGPVAVLLYRGPYNRIAASYADLYAWVGRNGYRPNGPVREVYLNGPDEVKAETDFVTELVVPIA